MTTYDESQDHEPVCYICGCMRSEHNMEGYPGHLFTRRDFAAEAIEVAEIARERLAEVAAENRKHRGMELFVGSYNSPQGESL